MRELEVAHGADTEEKEAEALPEAVSVLLLVYVADREETYLTYKVDEEN